MQAGQYVYAQAPAAPGLLLAALPIAGFDRAVDEIELYAATDGPAAHGGLLGLRPGEAAELNGPHGRGFAIDARSRYLLVVADADGLGRVRGIVDEAVATGRQVTVLFGAPTAAGVFPSTRLRDEVEYVVATEDGSLGHRGPVVDLVTAYEAWADQCFAAGSPALLARMATLARGRDTRMGVARLGRKRPRRGATNVAESRRRTWLQVAVAHEAGCALGVCLGCAVSGARGPLRACREGPAFAADELRWESGR